MSVLACKAGRFDSITSSARSKTADNRCVEKDRDQVATPARLRAMAARERHVGRIVGRAGAALQLGDCRATGRGHLAHKGRTDALHVCSGWRRILRYPLDMIIRAVKKLRYISTSIFGCPRLYFFALPGEQTSLRGRIATRRAGRGFLFSPGGERF